MLSSDSTVIEGVNHPSFSRFFEAPFSDRIPFQNGPEISFNGEVSTFLAIPIKRNDRLLSANAGESPSGGSFMSLLKAKNKSPVPGGSIGGLKPSSMRFLDFKRALLPSMLMAVRNMQPHGVSEKDGDNASEADGGYGSYRSSSSVTEVAELHTDPTAQPSAMLADMENALANGSSDSDSGIDRTELEKAEERIRVQLLQATGLLLPTDSQWYLLNELRIHAGAPERSEAGIERLSHYYAQLLYLEPKFPFETDEIRMNFNWYEAFFPGRRVITNCIQFEKASVLFNIAAVYTSLALSQSLWTPDGKRKAAKHFQKGAGVLFHIRDRLCARFKPKLDKQSDLSEVTLTAAAELMLAQAMECFYEKATDTKASSGVTAKIAAQTADYYEVASRAARLSTGNYKMRFPETWAQHIKSKTQMFSAIAHMHTAPESAAEAAVGERITRVSIAKELIEQAAKHSKDVGGALHELIQGHAKIIGTAHSFLVHANFERHHHPTFDHRLLPPLKRPQDSLVNPTPLEESIADPRNFPDLFHAIMSPTNHTGIKAILADCKQKIESGRSELLSCVVDIDCKLASLGLSVPQPLSPGEEAKSASPTGAEPMTTQGLQNRAMILVEEIRTTTNEEDAFTSAEMMECLDSLVRIAGDNIKESFEILNNQPASTASPHVVNVRAAATKYNSGVMEMTAQLADLKRKWDAGVADIAAYSEEDIETVLQINTSGYLQARNPLAHLESARRERDILLRKIDALRNVCDDHINEIEKLERADEASATSTSVGIDVHSAIQARHEQLRMVEDALKAVQKDKEGLLNRLEHLSRVLQSTSGGKGEAQTRQIVEKLLNSMGRYREWRLRLEDCVGKGLKTREESCRLLVRCLRLPKTPAPGEDGGDGPADSGDVPAKHIADPPVGASRDPLLLQLAFEDALKPLHSSLAVPIESSKSPKPGHAVPPYNPDVVEMSSTGRLSQLRSALASSGISPTGQMQRKDIEKVTFPEIEQPEVLMAGIDTRGGEDAWKNLLDAERERVTKLLIDKADSDLRLSRLEEELQHQAIQNAEAKAKRDEEARETLRNVPISNAPYHPLNAVQRDKSSVSPIKRKPAHPSGSRPNPASDAKGKKPAGPARSFSAAAVGADRIRQLLRFVGRKKDGSGTSPNLDPTSRKSSYATAYDGPPGGRIFSSASRLAEPPMRGHGPLPQPPVQTRQAPAVSENVHFEATLQVPKPASLGPSQASLAPSQRSVVEHASEDEHISRQLLAELKLEDYDVIQSPERDMTEMLPIATPDADLPTRMDDIYTQIRALMLSQDALRTQKANDMREALTTILESYNLRIGGVEDNVGHWTKAKLEDARNRLTDALERVEREEKRKLDEERLARGTDKLREQMYQREKSRREQREQEADRRRAEQRAFEKHFRQMVEEEERQAEKVRKDSYFVPRDASYTAGRLSKDDDPDARGPKDASRRKKGEKNQARDAESTSKSKDKGKGRADAHRSPPPAGRITEWVEEQRRMSQSSASGSGEASGAHAGHPDEGVAGLAGPSTSYHKAQIRARVEGVRDRGDTSNYERIASAAAAAAAAGVSVAFRMGDETDDGYAKGGTKSQQPAQPGRGISRRDPVGNVSFDLQPAHAEQSAVPPQHSIRRKPSTSFPMPHHPIQHPHPIEAAYADLQDPYEYHAYEDGHGPATAAEPFPRYSGHGRESDRRRKAHDPRGDLGGFKLENDEVAKDFVTDRVASFERTRKGPG